MLEAVSLVDQLTARDEDDLSVLVVGAGMAGLTLAQRLRSAGWHPTLVERSAPETEAGYMLGLMPLVDPAFDALGVQETFERASVPIHRYGLRQRHGRPLRELEFDQMLATSGSIRGISRGDLSDVLASDYAPVSYESTVRSLSQDDSGVDVQIDTSGSIVDARFDLVVAADGMGSTTRGLMLDEDEVATFHSGWGGWVVWTDAHEPMDRYDETWGAGFVIGSYPVPGRVGVFVGGPVDRTRRGPEAFADEVAASLRDPDERTLRSLQAVRDAEDPYFWSLDDVRAARWGVGRVQLLGDAAVGFLPTAGIGAGMAIEAAHGLAAHLLADSGASLDQRLEAHERVHRPRAEAAQDNSRALARLLARRSPLLAGARDLLTRFMPPRVVMGPISRLLEERPELPGQA